MSFAARRFQLFISGRTPNSRSAVANLRRALQRPEFTSIMLEIVDVIEAPEAAERAGVVRTPTLVYFGAPFRLVGDLSSEVELLRFLRKHLADD